MKYFINKIYSKSHLREYDYTLIDYEDKILLKGEYLSLSFVSNCVVYYEKFLTRIGKHDSIEVGFINLDQNKIIYSEENSVYNDSSTYGGYGILHTKYYDGLLKKTSNDKTVFIDENGIIKFEVSAKFDEIGNFSDDLVSCQGNNIEYYIFDYHSNKIELLNSIVVDYLKPRFKKHNENFNYYLIDENFIPFRVLNTEEKSLKSSDLTFFKYDEITTLWGYKDKTGEILIEPSFLFANKFINDIAIVEGYMDNGFIKQDQEKTQFRRYGYINKKGEYIIKPKYFYAYNFKNGIAIVIDSQGSNSVSGIINQKGEYIYFPQFHEIINIGCKRFLIFTKRKIGFLDKEGNWQIKPRFESVNSFKNGKCYVMENGLWGQIDKNGEWLIKPTFNNLLECVDYYKKININYE